MNAENGAQAVRGAPGLTTRTVRLDICENGVGT